MNLHTTMRSFSDLFHVPVPATPAPAGAVVHCLPDTARPTSTYAEPDGWLLLAAIVVCAAGRLAMGSRS